MKPPLEQLQQRQDHPKILSEVKRHKQWSHTVTDITPHESQFRVYLCSCGIVLGRNLL